MKTMASLVMVIILFATGAFGQLQTWRTKIAGPAFTVGINPHNPNTVYAQIGGPNLSVSYDRGKTWSFLGNPQLSMVRQILVHPSDTSVIFCAAFQGGIRRSNNGGFSWITVLPNFGIDGESISYDPNHPDTMYAGNFYDGDVFRSTNRGLTWSLAGTSSSLMCALAVRPDSSNIILAGTGNGRISKSTDRGATWRLVKEGGSQEIPRIVVSQDEPMTLYGTGYAGPDSTTGIWKSTDGGEHWSQTSLQKSVWAVDVDNTNANVVYAGTFNEDTAAVYKTTDGGATWTNLVQGFPGDGDAWSIKVHPTDPSMVWSALSGSSRSGIHRWQTTQTIVEGAVVNIATGDTVVNGSLKVVQTGDSVLLGNTGGRFRFGHFDGDTTFQPSVRSLAYPYFTSTDQIEFTPGSTVNSNFPVQKLPLSSITGLVRDLAHQPLQATLTLTASTSSGSIQYVTATTDGSFEFDSLYITHNPIIQYQELSISPTVPFRTVTISPIVVDSSGLIVDRLIDTADVLLTGPSQAGEIISLFQPMLDSIGVTFNYWNASINGPPPLESTGYFRKRSAIYSTGDLDSMLSTSDLDDLTACLESGSHLLITGENFVERHDSTTLVSEYAHVSFSGNSGVTAARGVSNELLTGLAIGFIGFSPECDSLTLLSTSAIPVMRYSAAFDLRGIAAIRVDTLKGRGRLVLFGFPFERGAIFEASRRNILQRVVGYFDGSIVVGVDEGLFDHPAEFHLAQNYPNPFNPSTVIQFTLPAKGHTTLRVFDILGREIKTLLDKQMEPGNHTVALAGAGLSSGVYFYTLSSGGMTDTRKMLLLK